jgi:IclR family transcriptional regulator, acetate operon repressor
MTSPDTGQALLNGSGPDTDGRLVGSDRVLAVLKELARHPERVTLDELTRVIGSPKPTVHRALAALRRARLARLDEPGHYLLGDEFLRIAFSYHEASPEHLRVLPTLQQLSERFGETAHYAVLDGTSVVYRAKVDPPRGAVRLTSTVGGRNPAHCTGVGKMLLAYELPTLQAVRDWCPEQGLEVRTPKTLATAEDLFADLQLTRQRGYSLDDNENEVGINCLAVPAFLGSPTRPSGAISISALAYRTPLGKLIDAFREISSLVGSPSDGR